MKYPVEIEESTARLWLKKGTISISSWGEENTYYVDQFDNYFVCKNYPQSVYRYPDVSCSQCGKLFGPGDHGFSHCKDHKGRIGRD